MSAILLTNPMPAPPAPNAPQQDVAMPLAIAPVAAGDATAAAGRIATDAGADAGPGPSRQGRTVDLMRIFKDGKWTRPPEPTGTSVVNAQAQEAEPLPKFDMPDPLPTSPFLKGAGEDR